jgi:F-type H+-transporting ATPase subunit gamma
MATAREMRLRIRSVNNISQVTRALEAVSASRIRRAEQQVRQTRPYASKAWQVLRHLALQPAKDCIHPLLNEREAIRRKVVVLITGDRGLAGAYNASVVRFAMERFAQEAVPVSYIVVGRVGAEMMARRKADIMAEFTDLPAQPSYADVSAIGSMAVEEFLDARADEVDLVYTDYVNLLRQVPAKKRLLPFTVHGEELDIGGEGYSVSGGDQPRAEYIYEPGMEELIDRLVPRLTELQVYVAILESSASEHAARMVAMRNATENAHDLASILRLEYNKARQQGITNDMLDIAGGAEALSRVRERAG